MESLIPVINKLQDVFNTIGCAGIKLPQIVVVGTQSSGKSSVLENVVGRSFLPRGTGIVTRTPLVLQLVHSPRERRAEDAPSNVDDYGVFLHCKKIFTDFEDIRTEIEMHTERITATKKGISDEVISLKIYSPTVVNLTLVDLPGLTKVPVGDQPEDIETQIRDLVLKYITNPNSIIMAVVTANTDMATNESLKLAKDCDPKGDRTLAVVTKLDLMDAGTDATDILSGRVIPVKLGIIGVVNRSQRDIEEDKPIAEAHKHEAQFLLKNYPALADCNGTPFLAKTLNKLLMKHIKNCLPDLKKRVQSMIYTQKELLRSYGEDDKDKDKLLLKIIADVASAYGDAITGASANVQSKTLTDGARICHIFHETFKTELNKIDPLLGLDRRDILTLMRNASGTRPALFIPEVAFEVLVREQIKLLEDPSLRCAESVREELQQILHKCFSKADPHLERFPVLRDKMLDLFARLLDERSVITKSTITNLIQAQLAYINTRHPQFERAKALLTQDEDEDEDEDESTIIGLNKKAKELDEKDCVVVEKLLSSYFETVRTTVHDVVPKIVMHCLVNFLRENVGSELTTKFYRSPDSEHLFQEAKHIAQKRKLSVALLAALYQASNIINEIRDFYV